MNAKFHIIHHLFSICSYTYKLGHRLFNGTYIWSQIYQFRASPYPGQTSLQRVVIFGDMGKVWFKLWIYIFKNISDLQLWVPVILQGEADGSLEYNNFQPGSLNTTKQLINDLKNIDIVFHIGDICYALGYLSQWDQFTSQIEPIASRVPYMIARFVVMINFYFILSGWWLDVWCFYLCSGNHERDWPGTGSFYGNMDSGGECGVLAETMFYVPADNRAKFW